MSKVLKVDQGDYIVQVENGRTIIDNDFIVKGKSLGTAPVVTNVLYVTMEGSDTNDGSAQDASKACRTVSGAVKSPLYQPGTSIKVSAGHYYENNPIVVKPYTSIIGSDLRTTSLEPINKTQDLFHVNSSSYLAQMQFINGRSGIVNPNLDRGAYCVSFPNVYGSTFQGSVALGSSTVLLQNGFTTANCVIGMEIISPVVSGTPLFSANTTVVSIDSASQLTLSSIATSTVDPSLPVTFTTGKITVYKSPYVQNCTNQTGPWLYDGTMFIPNQTVQIPLAVGTTTFDNNVSVINVSLDEGTDISAGMSINTAPQDQGFFTARTLILANETFIQEQVLEHIRITYPTTLAQWDAFNNRYDKEKCRRDIATIIEHVLYDTTFGGNSRSIQAGNAYWNGVVSVLAGEQVQTINALEYIKTIVRQLIDTASGVSGASVTNLFANPSVYVTASSVIPGRTYTIKTIGTSDWTTAGATATLATSMIQGVTYIITDIGTTTNWTAIGAGSSPAVGTTFTKNNVAVTGKGGKVFPLNYTFIATSRGSGNGTAQYGVLPKTPSNLAGGQIALTPFDNYINLIEYIIDNDTFGIVHPSLPAPDVNIYYSTGPEFGLDSAELLIIRNKTFVQKNVTSFIDYTFPSFANKYDIVKSERDVGFIVDAIAQDILLGGNARSYTMALSYYVDGISVLSATEATYCLYAFEEIKSALIAIVNNTVYYDGSRGWAAGNPVSQQINVDLINGNRTVALITRNIDIISSAIQYGLAYTTAQYKQYSGTALFSATGVSADNVQLSTIVTSANHNIDGTWDVTLSTPTVGIGNNAKLYFGYPSVYPVVESTISDRWANRKCDPWGAMGGMLIDGEVVTDNSPVRSFVADAFTQVNQGGRGVRVTNRGYVQLVSVFTIFSSVAVEADNGGIASITNSNANFGEYCMISKGYGPKEFTGTVYNPESYAYDSVSNSFVKNIYYPSGFFPHKQQVCIFVPDTIYRPHISLMMEVIPPITYVNAQGMPGFLTATVTFSTITEGDLSITGIDVSNMYIGQRVYLHDQYGSYKDPTDNKLYIQAGTVITDMGPQTIYLSKPLTKSGGDINNPSYFTLFTCGNAYYSILTSTPSANPSITSDETKDIAIGDLILPNKQITGDVGVNNPEIQSLNKLGALLRDIVTNTLIASQSTAGVTQTVDESYIVTPATQDHVYSTATGSTGLINQIISVLTYNGVPDTMATMFSDSTKTTEQIINTIGTATTGFKYIKKGTPSISDGAAAQLILKNIEFCVEEVFTFIRQQIGNAAVGSNWDNLIYDQTKCRRDIALICTNIAYDLIDGGNYNTCYSGLSYYARPGTYHIVEIEDNITAYSLMPDGAIVNFYQRSYMSASGYLFEYVGAGTNYGALPQVGRVDPKQYKEVNMLNGGKVFFTSTDQNGDFRIGPGLVISQATGVLSGRTFQKSLFAEMTPFILAIEG